MNENKQRFNYFGIIKNAWEITRENRFLWAFGMLLTLGSGGVKYIFPGVESGQDNKWEKNASYFSKLFSAHSEIMPFLILLSVILVITLFSLRVRSIAGLVWAINQLSFRKKTSFNRSWQIGKKAFWKIVGIDIFIFVLLLFFFTLLFFPVVYLFIAQSWIKGLIILLLGISVIIPIGFVLVKTQTFAYYYTILSGLSMRSALSSAYNLLFNNLEKTIIFSLLSMGINLVAALFIFLTIIILSFTFLPPAIFLYYLGPPFFIPFAIISLLVFFLSLLLINSFVTAFYYTYWVLFFKEIAQIKDAEEKEGVISEREIAVAQKTLAKSKMEE